MKQIDLLSKPVVFLSSPDSGLLRRQYRDLRAQLVAADLLEDAEPFSGASDPQEWIAAAGSAPFIAERRVVIVRQVFQADKKKLDSADWSAVPASGLLVLVGDIETNDQDRLRSLKTQSDKLAKAVTKAGGLVAAAGAEPTKAIKMIQEAAEAQGKKIGPKTAELLLEMVGGHIGDALDEVDKLVLYVGDEPTIREADATKAVVPAREWNVFLLIDSVTAGNAAAALRQLRILISNPGSLTDSAIRSLLPLFVRQMSLLWQARMVIEGSFNLRNPSGSLLERLPDKPKIVELTPYRQNAIVSSGRKATFEQIARCWQLTADADSALKGALPSYSAEDTLELLVIEMARVFARAS